MTASGPDLKTLAALLAQLPPTTRQGFVIGKTACKNAIAQHLQCSEAEAERLVDTMVGRGFLRFDDSDGTAEQWVVTQEP